MSPRSDSGLEFNVSVFREALVMSVALREAHPSTTMPLKSKRRDNSVEFRESNSAIWGQEASFRRQLDRLRDATVVLVLSAFTSWERDEGMISSDRRRIG